MTIKSGRDPAGQALVQAPSPAVSALTGFDPSRLEDAIAFAAHCHKGQLDKGGQPYILHALRVMLRLTDEDGRIAAVLHDVVEDCGVEPVYIRMGYGDAVADAVDALTRREGESYGAFIERCGANEIARVVKLADLDDNMDIARLGREPTTIEDARRQVKYADAKNRLHASAIDARRAAAENTDAVHESAVVATSDETPSLSKDSPGISTPIRGGDR